LAAYSTVNNQQHEKWIILQSIELCDPFTVFRLSIRHGILV
jgi:hypothetical protein